MFSLCRSHDGYACCMKSLSFLKEFFSSRSKTTLATIWTSLTHMLRPESATIVCQSFCSGGGGRMGPFGLHPRGRRHPGRVCMGGGEGGQTLPIGYYGILSTSRRYASYWNAFLCFEWAWWIQKKVHLTNIMCYLMVLHKNELLVLSFLSYLFSIFFGGDDYVLLHNAPI